MLMKTKLQIRNTRKYPLRGYILGVLTHTTALDRLWGGDGPRLRLAQHHSDHVALKLSYVARLCLALQQSDWLLEL